MSFGVESTGFRRGYHCCQERKGAGPHPLGQQNCNCPITVCCVFKSWGLQGNALTGKSSNFLFWLLYEPITAADWTAPVRPCRGWRRHGFTPGFLLKQVIDAAGSSPTDAGVLRLLQGIWSTRTIQRVLEEEEEEEASCWREACPGHVQQRD